ncbi:rhombosortase [Shewanella indica]|uniref:rhombosortase n=1 Tax=Shewanella indica TaxID=768528 RepID=UPI00313E2B9A
MLTALALLLYFLPLTELFAFRRSAIEQGELWRLVSGNLLHTNFWHLLMNLAGFWVILYLHKEHYNALGVLILTLALCLFEGVGLYLCYPELMGYVGLSGILHGLFAFGALADIRSGRSSGYLLLAGVIAKVGWEQWQGAAAEVSALIGARVAVEAHLVGLIGGIALFGLWRQSTYKAPKL